MVQNPVILTTHFNITKLCITVPTHTFPMFLETATTSLSSSNGLSFLMDIQAACCVPGTALSCAMCINIVVQEATLKVHVMFPYWI
jgi:hypothetical protein